MSTLDQIAEAASRLSPKERRELIARLQDIDPPKPRPTPEERHAAMQRFLAMAGTGQTDFPDVSTDKYKHYGDVYGDKK